MTIFFKIFLLENDVRLRSLFLTDFDDSFFLFFVDYQFRIIIIVASSSLSFTNNFPSGSGQYNSVTEWLFVLISLIQRN